MVSMLDNMSVIFKFCIYLPSNISIKEISEMNIKMNVIFIHEESNYDAFIQEANIVMKK
jgi:hypothetical protein